MNDNEDKNTSETAESAYEGSLFGEKDQLIAHFQDLTSIDDIGRCFEYLETANWNLNDAVQTYFTQNELIHQQKQEEPESVNIDNDAAINIDVPSTVNSNMINFASNFQVTGSSLQDLKYVDFSYPRRFLDFEIEYKTKKEVFHIADTETISTLKKLCEKEFNIPFDKQIIKGWKDRDPTLLNTDIDSVKLRDLQLPLKTTLYLFKKKTNEQNRHDEDVFVENTLPSTSKLSSPKQENLIELCTYDILININITNLKVNMPTTSSNSDLNNTKQIYLKYESDKKFLKLKQDLSKVSNLNVNNQAWYWKYPETELEQNTIIKDEFQDLNLEDRFVKINKDFDNLNLYELKNHLYNLYSGKFKNNTNLFKLEFNVKENEEEKQKSKENNEIIIDNDDDDDIQEIPATSNSYNHDEDDDSHDEDEDDMHFCFSDTNVTTSSLKRKALISDDYKSEEEAIDNFIKEFSCRYGPIIPLFHYGSLEDAIEKSLLRPVNDRKLLAIYLHSDNTLYSNIFCSKILCDEEIISYLTTNFIVWPWDLTLTKNETFFYSLCSKHFGGSTVIHTIKQSKDKLPAILLLTRVRSNNEIIAVIEGDATKEHLMIQLIQADELFQQQCAKDSIEEKQREEREKIKREQDAAYQASLDYDKAKRQKQEEEMNRKQELMRQHELTKIQQEKEFNEKKLFCLNKLKEEPELTNENSKLLTTIRIKEPNGKILQRRFYANDLLDQIICYLGSLGYFDNKYKLLTTWPRRDLAFESKITTLQDLKLYPQETIILEERDEIE